MERPLDGGEWIDEAELLAGIAALPVRVAWDIAPSALAADVDLSFTFERTTDPLFVRDYALDFNCVSDRAEVVAPMWMTIDLDHGSVVASGPAEIGAAEEEPDLVEIGAPSLALFTVADTAVPTMSAHWQEVGVAYLREEYQHAGPLQWEVSVIRAYDAAQIDVAAHGDYWSSAVWRGTWSFAP